MFTKNKHSGAGRLKNNIFFPFAYGELLVRMVTLFLLRASNMKKKSEFDFLNQPAEIRFFWDIRS